MHDGSEWLSKIYDAVFHRKKISFTFNIYNDRSDHVLEPYMLKEYSSRWYVAGMEEHKAAMFGLDRMSNLGVIDRDFLFVDSFFKTVNPCS